LVYFERSIRSVFSEGAQNPTGVISFSYIRPNRKATIGNMMNMESASVFENGVTVVSDLGSLSFFAIGAVYQIFIKLLR